MNIKRALTANLLAGFVPGLLAPILWPFVVFAIEGAYPDWSVYAVAALSISFFAIILGLGGCVLLGTPTLTVLDKLQLNSPLVAAAAGLLLSLVAFIVLTISNNPWPISQSWPLALFFAVNGAACGYFAGAYMHSNKSFKRDRPKRAAP